MWAEDDRSVEISKTGEKTGEQQTASDDPQGTVLGELSVLTLETSEMLLL